MNHLDAVLSRLEGVKPNGSGYCALCPAHDDRNPSLSIGTGDNSKILLNCHAGCSFESIIAAIGLKPTDLRPPSTQSTKRKIVATYDYCDENGVLLYQKVRFEPKDFLIRRPDGDDWIWEKGDARPVLYRLPELLQAKTEGKTVFHPEGEKDADRLHSLSLTATTNFEGASKPGKRPKWRREYSEQLAGASRVVILADSDPPGRAHAADIARKLAGKVADIRVLELPGAKDVSTWLDAGHTVEELLQLVEATEPYHRPEIAEQSDQEQAADRPYSLGFAVAGQQPQSLVAAILAEHNSGLAYDHVAQKWMLWVDTQWKEITDPAAFRVVMDWIDRGLSGEGYTISFANGIVAFLKARLATDGFDDNPRLVPFLNGVLDLATMTLIPHSPELKIAWCLPFNYDPAATCEPVKAWLKESVGGDDLQVELLRAYIKAILTGRYDLQRYLELIGPGGTGKGVFIDLCAGLAGKHNVHVTELKRLENNRFEPARLYRKRLCIITDAEKYTGDVAMLKAMTGKDDLPFEEKHKQGGESFKFKGMVLIGANQEIASSDMTSGLQRRRITVRFDNQVDPAKRRNLEQEFKPYLPGVIAWALSMDDATMKQLLVETDSCVPMVGGFNLQTLKKVNPLAAWADECLIWDPNAETPVGVCKQYNLTIGSRDESLARTKVIIEHTDDWLYPNYVDWCKAKGNKPASSVNFTSLLKDLLCCQLKLEGIEKLERAGAKLSRFKGIRLRADVDQDIENLLIRYGLVRVRYGLGTGYMEEGTGSTGFCKFSTLEHAQDENQQLDNSNKNANAADMEKNSNIPVLPVLPVPNEQNQEVTKSQPVPDPYQPVPNPYRDQPETPNLGDGSADSLEAPPDFGTSDEGYWKAWGATAEPAPEPSAAAKPPARPTSPIGQDGFTLLRWLQENKKSGWESFRWLAPSLKWEPTRLEAAAMELHQHRLAECANSAIRIQKMEARDPRP